MVQGLVDNLIVNVDVAVLASQRGQLAEGRVGKVEASSAVGVPLGVAAVGAALAAVADEEGNVGLDAVDGDDDSLAAVLGTAGRSLEGEVAHGDEVVGVDIVERLGGRPVAHDRAKVLVVEVGAAGLTLLDVVVVGGKALALEDGGLGRGADSESESSEGTDGELHLDIVQGK